MTNLTIKLFNKAIPTQNNLTFKEVNELAVKEGYLIHPDVCNSNIYSWLHNQKRDYNSTFYKSWSDVISRSRFDLFIDQLLHYASTYGTNFEGEPYLPGDAQESDIEIPEFTNFKVILPITKEEVITRCSKMLYNNFALKQETIEDILNILNELDYKIDINLVKNKEAKMFLYKRTGSLPVEPVEMVRYLVYLSTGRTLLIKDKQTIESIKDSGIQVGVLINQFGIKELSTVFNRFKPIFLAFRNDVISRCAINKLRRLAVKNHIPLKKGYFETLLSTLNIGDLIFNQNDLNQKLDTISNFKKISLLQSILIRQKELDNRDFVVRNQKIFIKEEKQRNPIYLSILYGIIYKHLINSLKSKACNVLLPQGVNLTLPTSEKSFIGNYPLGTSFDFSDSHNVFGINWKEIDGARDLDLKMIDIDGKQYGWNADYYNENNSIIYSGDMTSADPEATELFYTSENFNPSIVKVNLYSGYPNSKFRFFIAKEPINNMERNYMVDPNNIIINIDCEMDSQEKCLGVITEDKFILAQFKTGRGRVANNSVTDLYTEYALKTLDCYLNLENVLSDAGFRFINYTTDTPDIDLTELSKDTLINLIS